MLAFCSKGRRSRADNFNVITKPHRRSAQRAWVFSLASFHQTLRGRVRPPGGPSCESTQRSELAPDRRTVINLSHTKSNPEEMSASARWIRRIVSSDWRGLRVLSR
jgi:hypothetical protein